MSHSTAALADFVSAIECLSGPLGRKGRLVVADLVYIVSAEPEYRVMLEAALAEAGAVADESGDHYETMMKRMKNLG